MYFKMFWLNQMRLKVSSFHQLINKGQSRSVHEYIKVINLSKNIAAIDLNKGPVNTLNLEIMEEVTDAIQTLEELEDCKAVVFTSNYKVFCAGFDLYEFWKPEVKRLESFWRVAHNLALKILKTPLVTASAVNGHCIAGGCIFPFLSDISVMNDDDKIRIGLSATRMGFVPPDMLLIPMKNAVGHRQAELLGATSKLIKPKEAFKIKMIQTIVDCQDVLPETVNIVESYLKIPEGGRIATKLMFNQSTLKDLDNEERIQKEVKEFSDHILSSKVQELVDKHLMSVKNR